MKKINTLFNQFLNQTCIILCKTRKFFEKSKNREKPFKFEEVVDRLRSAISKKVQQKKMLEQYFYNNTVTLTIRNMSASKRLRIKYYRSI